MQSPQIHIERCIAFASWTSPGKYVDRHHAPAQDAAAFRHAGHRQRDRSGRPLKHEALSALAEGFAGAGSHALDLAGADHRAGAHTVLVLQRAVSRDGKTQQVVARGRTHLNNGESMRDAAVAGLGLAALPLFIAAPALRDGRLVEVLPKTPPVADLIQAVYPQTRYVSRAVRAVIDMLVKAFAREVPWEKK